MHGPLAPQVLDALPDAVLTIDRTSTIVAANRAALALFGRDETDFVGRPLGETIIPPDLRAQHARGMERFAQTGHGPVIGRRIEISAVDRGGRRFPIELCVFLDPVRPGELFHAMIRDISDRAAGAAAAAAESGRLREFLDATADAWWDARPGGSTRYGDGAAGLLGVDVASMPDVDPSRLPWIHEGDRARVAAAWAAHLDGSVGRYECTHRVVASDDGVRWIRARGRAVEFDAGRPVRLVGTLTDVTELQAAEEALRNAQRLEMLGLLAGGFAHDLNNLLAVVRGQAALVASERGLGGSALESLEAIQLATTKAKMLTSNMLSLGKPGGGESRRFGVRAAIEETVQLVGPGLPKSIVLSLDLAAADALEVEMSEGAFQQAILNLVVNARDAMPSGGVLRVTALPRRAGDGRPEATIVVEDTGQGIEPARLARVFEPFYTTKPKGVGTGLGLAVVAQSVRSGGGTVSVESEPGRGTRFTIVLPAVAGGVAEETREAAPGATPAPGPLRVLLAEDHALLRPMLVESLKSLGCEVAACEDGGSALAWIVERAPSPPVDVAILDVAMPGLDGFRLHGRIESELGRRMPVVFISGEPGSALPAEAPSHMRILFKPFEPAALLRSAHEVLRATGG
jgi:two-component system cell cycle sensor histidine kinase/response regulator CckA